MWWYVCVGVVLFLVCVVFDSVLWMNRYFGRVGVNVDIYIEV